MLESSGYETKGLAYLVYYWANEVKEKGLVKSNVELTKIETNIN
jgi:hypothetical protein